MSEKPILFSASMVRAIIDGRKTQTRRVVKLPLIDRNGTGCEIAGCEINSMLCEGRFDLCPYGGPEDHIWVRETFQPLWTTSEPGEWKTGEGYKISYPATDGIKEFMLDDEEWSQRCWPSIHMPRWASRITLEVLSVCVERLRDITAADCISEGVSIGPLLPAQRDHAAKCAFREFWDSLAKPGFRWADNPWVWRIEFKGVK